MFIIIIAGLFIANREIIGRNIQNTGFFDKLLNRETPPSAEMPPETLPEVTTVNPPAEKPPAVTVPPPAAEPSRAPAETTPAAKPVETTKPANPPIASQPPALPTAKPAETKRDRPLYFMKIDNDGTIVRTKVSRAVTVSDSPMMDVLDVLLQGPSADEKKKGLVSLIPQGTKILSATVRGSTAYISFSEEFQFNTYGVEGYAAQLKQIVWTVTEFQNVKDVQVLLEGRRIDYLGEGIWIGSPLGRESL